MSITGKSKVEKKILEVEEKDQVRNFQPPVSGEEIMGYFNLRSSKEVGVVKEAILEGKIRNNREEAWQYMLEVVAKGLGLEPVK